MYSLFIRVINKSMILILVNIKSSTLRFPKFNLEKKIYILSKCLLLNLDIHHIINIIEDRSTLYSDCQVL